ncbi:hypothetical protein LJC71_01820 [Desulfosarcina sp. OttesenSCG-928-A07]|nr:hypothetical protein [Desulfosarcina sp. OttesenSCG-928-A07]
MMVGLIIFLVMLLALMYSLGGTKKKKSIEEERKPQVAEMPLAMGQGQGLALPPPPQTPAVAVARVEDPKPRKNLVVHIGGDQQPINDQNQKRREQMYIAALSSPVLAQKGKNSAQDNSHSQESGQNASVYSTITTQEQQRTDYDPAANIDKENFFMRADTAGDTGAGWLSRYTREEGRPLELKTGTVIPAVMVTGINSALPGVIVAQVSQNVYNTATGEYLLIPQGAKLYGIYDSRVVYGQERVLVAWNRIIFPDGSSVTLGAMPGADMSGYSGFKDKVNNHYIKAYGNAFLMSMIIGSTSYLVDRFDDDDDYDAYGNEKTSFSDEIGKAIAMQMGQASMRILEKNLNISPTLEIRPGYQLNVMLTKDVAFKEPYFDQFTGDSNHAHAIDTVRP